MEKTKFLLDANFLIIPVQFRVDIYAELLKFGQPELYTIDLVLDELGRLKGGNLAFRLFLKNEGMVMVTKGKNADDEIFRLVKKGEYVVCTQDQGLQERIRKAGGKIVFLRQKRYLEMV
jgi:rRNA-processing protein FCF1